MIKDFTPPNPITNCHPFLEPMGHPSSWSVSYLMDGPKKVAINVSWFHDNSSTDISSTTLRLQTFRLQTFRLLLCTSVQDSYTSNFCFSKSLFSSIPTSTYTMIPFYQSHFH